MSDPEMSVETIPNAFALQFLEFPLGAANDHLAFVENGDPR
jgi:hypothetical protein